MTFEDTCFYMGVYIYRAGTSIHSGLIKLLSNCEGDMGGPHRGGGLDWKRLSVLRNLHGWLWRCCDGNLTQHHVHTWQNTHAHQNNLLKNSEYSDVQTSYGKVFIYRVFESDVIKTGCAPYICALPTVSDDITWYNPACIGKAVWQDEVPIKMKIKKHGNPHSRT